MNKESRYNNNFKWNLKQLPRNLDSSYFEKKIEKFQKNHLWGTQLAILIQNAFSKGVEWLFRRMPELHLELCQTSVMEYFCKNFQFIIYRYLTGSSCLLTGYSLMELEGVNYVCPGYLTVVNVLENL